ncbi:hypothetical protein BGY98DRAFT_179334 [Russula aff. rugulosa BPL654]|nr:hypothetical protein BGY98DRAFT_179334 [Russula aff. rugulosa BPL654]
MRVLAIETMHRLCSDAKFIRSVWQPSMPWQPTLIPLAPLAHASSPSSYPLSSAWPSHLHNHHSLDSATERWCRQQARRCRTSLGSWAQMLAGRRANCNSESVMVRLPDQHSADRLPTFSCHFFTLLHQSARQGGCTVHRSSRMYTHISSECNSFISLSRPRGVYLPSLQHLAVQKRPACSTEPVRAPDPPNATTLP